MTAGLHIFVLWHPPNDSVMRRVRLQSVGRAGRRNHLLARVSLLDAWIVLLQCDVIVLISMMMMVMVAVDNDASRVYLGEEGHRVTVFAATCRSRIYQIGASAVFNLWAGDLLTVFVVRGGVVVRLLVSALELANNNTTIKVGDTATLWELAYCARSAKINHTR